MAGPCCDFLAQHPLLGRRAPLPTYGRKLLMSTRARCVNPAPELGAPGTTTISAKVPATVGLHKGPGFTKSLLSTKCPPFAPFAEGKRIMSGTSLVGKSKAAARASETCAGSRGSTGKRLRCWRSSRKACSTGFSCGRRTRPERSTELKASPEVTLTRRPPTERWAGFGTKRTPSLLRGSSFCEPRAWPKVASRGGWGIG
mmetsp:Transcript_98020/g.204457  ORF Transcript_98020/g.204457 Transcript_98020/m.204457 type:complete len:200 (+) Transcript_98020:343-942(+)